MAVYFQTTVHAQQPSLSHCSLSCATKRYSGLKLKSSGFGAEKPSLSVQFFGKVHNTLHQIRNPTASRGQIRMMPIGTPRVPYKVPGESNSWQWVDLWNALYRERVIFLGQEIDEKFSNTILATMLYLDSIDDKRLYFYINGPGGDLTPCLAIYDTMQSLKSAVATHCLGYAFNLSAFILAAGEKGTRYTMPLSRISIEPPAGSARGRADDVQNETRELLRIRDYLYGELARQTGQPIEKIHKDLSRAMRLSAEEAVEYGIIDRIARPPRIKADAPRKDAGTGLG